MKNGIVPLWLLFVGSGVTCTGENLLSDGTFSAAKGTYPDKKTLPWLTTGEDGGWAALMDSERSFDDQGQSLKFNRWGGNINVLQNTGHVIKPDHAYQASLHMMTGEPSEDPEHTAKPGIFVTLASAKEVAGPYQFRKQFFWEITTSKHEVWEPVEGVIEAKHLEAWVGEYIQLRIVKKSMNSSHVIWVDNVQLIHENHGTPQEESNGLIVY